ncbi:acyl-CoA dehydrogenase family protein [Pseudorhodoferax sp. Leaf267]|uniref:acyl-CoA dehydrogenase family protein n=1 Tax=Pseudorhodoferax sp. Leaf267 TaxID=1736316 RepID=UPI0006F8FB40|nr:acyl-CoA dehydrogenase family protein [Pseudorhodoferax sp. Leaf267]KQP14190.1 acyl-CoA dehydrogenase [Pseudorhodoferax sp. Leaf267]
MSKPTLTPELAQIRDAITALCDRFDDDYWLHADREHRFPHAFHRAVAEAGWLGITLPEAYGGAGLGVTEAAWMMQLIASSAGTMAACSAVHINIFGPHAISKHCTEEQKRRLLPPLSRGEELVAFGVTEPDAGLNTTQIATRAVRSGDGYVINGQKVWTSTAQQAHKIMLLVRTAPYDAARPTDGITLFYTDLDRRHIEVREIEKHGRAAVDSNALFINDLQVPARDRIGAEGQGFRIILDSMNPERILVAAEAIGIGRRALAKATAYAKERVVFGRPIGQNQAIQHPLAESWAELEAANLMAFHAAELYDAGQPCGPEANAAKVLAAEAGYRACDRAVRTHGGFGYARHYHVERYLREAMLPRIAPVSRELVLCHIAERVLGLPKSY